MTRTHITRVGAVTMALLLTGCATESGAESAGGGSGRSAGDESPLAEYLGAAYQPGDAGLVMVSGFSTEISEDERQRFREIEDLVAECMRNAGFEYVPRSLDDMAAGGAAFNEAFSLDPEEFARTYGYGISTLLMAGAGDDSPDPNREIRDGLSESARAEYDAALWGDLANFMIVDDADSERMLDFDFAELGDTGCHGSAAEQVYGSDLMEPVEAPEFGNLVGDLQALHERIERDPQVAAAIDDWRQCMADAGHPGFTRIPDAQESVFTRMDELYRATDDVSESDVAVAIGGRDSDLDPDLLADVQEYEIDVATADFACQQEHYLDVYRDVAFGMEREFVEANRPELEQYRDWLADHGGQG